MKRRAKVKHSYQKTQPLQFKAELRQLKQRAVGRMKPDALFQIYCRAIFARSFEECIYGNFRISPDELTKKERNIAEIYFASMHFELIAKQGYDEIVELMLQRCGINAYICMSKEFDYGPTVLNPYLRIR